MELDSSASNAQGVAQASKAVQARNSALIKLVLLGASYMFAYICILHVSCLR